MLKNEASIFRFNWFKLPGDIDIDFTFLIDNQSLIMSAVVGVVALMVILYSIEYKKEDKHYARFFMYITFFVLVMLGVVFSDNLLLTFVFWELVGFASYLLIGFWYDKNKAVEANKKAFLVNRVADVFFIIGILMIWTQFRTLDVWIIKQISVQNHYSSWAMLFIFIGCMGKSAQFPFQIWLPNAMEGSTPVSALIHAATMVAAGVYLMVKLSFLITPDIGYFISIIGAVTALSGAYFAICQYDIKRVLAFSTISQLGFMMAAIGLGAYEAAFFHLITHAFFKACLFLSAGSVIHGFHHLQISLARKEKGAYFDKQDMRIMGGVKKYMPVTFFAFLLSALSLIGLPLFSGFLSKDLILTAAFNASIEQGNLFILLCLLSATCMTSYYVFRLIFNVFFGEIRIKKILEKNLLELHESKWMMLFPMLILAFLSLGIAFNVNPFSIEGIWFLGQFEFKNLVDVKNNYFLIESIAVALSFVGFSIAFYLYNPLKKSHNEQFRDRLLTKFTFAYKLSFHQLYMDRVVKNVFITPTIRLSKLIHKSDALVLDKGINLFGISQVVLAHITNWIDKILIDGLVHLIKNVCLFIGNKIRKLQSRNIQGYFLWVLLAIIAIIGWFIY